MLPPPPRSTLFPYTTLFRSGFPLPYGSTPGITRGGKSHSGISGSKAACAYPELIAACHALRQRPSRAIRQVAYHAEPFRNPRSIRVKFLRLPLHSTSSWTLVLSRISLSPSSLSRHVLRVAF